MAAIIYVEQAIRQHPRVRQALKRLNPKQVIECEHYGEIFNPKGQNFRQQKLQPALILAEKQGRKVLPTPEGFGIGGQQNYYFSHMLNCVYDCRYCFLQGMYPSAHWVWFVNYEAFIEELTQTIVQQTQPSYFFSGYDCDSLAFDSQTRFIDTFLPFFAQYPQALLELRTKSTHIRSLLKHAALPNCVVAFSLTPAVIAEQVEHKTPSVAKRIHAMQQLAHQGWQIGVRLDPLIYASNFTQLYQQLIDEIMHAIPSQSIHSISVGPLRFPTKMYQRLVDLYPQDRLLAHPLHKRDQVMSYQAEREQQMVDWVQTYLRQYVDDQLIFQCTPW
ncbi:MAG: DNA photolyase [Legionellales bacterium]|nr:DNA photolyase [Legionellales bacterium]